MSLVEVTVDIRARHADGTVVSRSVVVKKDLYRPETALVFRGKAKRQALSALNAVVGTSPGVRIEEPS